MKQTKHIGLNSNEVEASRKENGLNVLEGKSENRFSPTAKRLVG